MLFPVSFIRFAFFSVDLAMILISWFEHFFSEVRFEYEEWVFTFWLDWGSIL